MLINYFFSGAFSDVYRAKDKRTGRNVAIKVAQKYTEEEPMVCKKPDPFPCMLTLFFIRSTCNIYIQTWRRNQEWRK